MTDLSEDEVWAEIEKMVFEELPEFMSGFDKNYEAPNYLNDACQRCGATVVRFDRELHSKWHRALSLRIHLQMGLFNFIASQLKIELPDAE